MLGIITYSVITSGFARASIPDSNGVLHACLAKSGSIRIIDDSLETCRSQETAISWNTTGPSNAFVKVSGTIGTVIGQNSYTDIVTVSLPAGSYVLNATVAFRAFITDNTTIHGVQCVIRGTSVALSTSPEISFPPTNTSFVAMSLSTAFTLALADSVSLACRSDAFTTVEIRTPGTITAIQVATLTNQ
jgi:hypothetical protein